MTDEFLKYLKDEHAKAVKESQKIARTHPDLDGGWKEVNARENQLKAVLDKYKETHQHDVEIEECPFCECNDDHYITGNQHWYARYDEYPVTKGHVLVIPFSHVTKLDDLDREEVESFPGFLMGVIESLKDDFTPDGFNIGINLGEAAGQTVKHLHIHVIPRYKGDVPNPRGGVRGVIPGKQNYNGAS